MKQNNQKITKELIKNNVLVFRPKNVAEAVFIQRKLFDLGARWYWGDSPRVSYVDECISRGIEVHKGKVFCGGVALPTRASVACHSGQFDEPFNERDVKNLYVPTNQAFIMEMFNQMAERVDKLTEEVEKLRREVEAQKPGKPKFSP